MSLLGINLTKANIDAIAWQEVVVACVRKECNFYDSAFYDHARIAESNGNINATALYTFLGAICSFRVKLDTPEEPFSPAFEFQAGRSPSIEDLEEEHFQLLLELAPETVDPELQARMADILWVCRRDFRMALMAVDAYLASAQRLEDPEHWSTGLHRVERAMQISASLGRNNAALPKAIAYIEERLRHYNGTDPLFLSVKLMELLQEQRQGDPATYAALAEKIALQAEVEQKWHKARASWSVLARWHRVERDAALEREAQLHLAETYASEAQAAFAHNPNDHSLVAYHLQQAIASLRRVAGTGERVTELHRQLLNHQQQSVGQMQVATTSIDVSELAEQARNAVANKEPLRALVSLALLSRPLSVTRLRDEVRRTVRSYPLQFIFSAVQLNEEGKVIARRPSLTPADLEADEALLRTEMFRQASWHRGTMATGAIEHARHQINLEHNIRIQDWMSIVAENPFVPEGRELLYARGLHAGLIGDFITALHILIPQVEHSLRNLMSEAGLLVSGIDSAGIQDEHNINSLLYREELKAMLGEDIVFELQGLLVERFGENMRNRLAHGLLSSGAFFASSVVYLWWLVLQLCCLPVAPQILGQSSEASRSQSASTADSPSSQDTT